MGSNTQLIFGEYALLKVIEDPDGVRIKICPAFDKRSPGEVDRYDETDRAIDITLPRVEANRLVKAVRHARNRIWGADE